MKKPPSIWHSQAYPSRTYPSPTLPLTTYRNLLQSTHVLLSWSLIWLSHLPLNSLCSYSMMLNDVEDQHRAFSAAHKAIFWAFWRYQHHRDLVPELLIWEVSDSNIRDKWVHIFAGEVHIFLSQSFPTNMVCPWGKTDENSTSRKIRGLSKIKTVFCKYCHFEFFPFKCLYLWGNGALPPKVFILFNKI